MTDRAEVIVKETEELSKAVASEMNQKDQPIEELINEVSEQSE